MGVNYLKIKGNVRDKYSVFVGPKRVIVQVKKNTPQNRKYNTSKKYIMQSDCIDSTRNYKT